MSKKFYPSAHHLVKVFYTFIVLLVLFSSKLLAQAIPCTPPTASISFVSSSICRGNQAFLKLNTATGQGPFNLTVNGVNYTNISVGQTFGPLTPAESSVFTPNDVPVTPDYVDGRPVELGTKIRSSVAGYITGIRFYKGVSNTGTHTGTLWSSSGTLLATGTFTGETASGWQILRFTSPVAIQANTTYVASYYSPNGYYALSLNYFTTQAATNGTLTALQSGTDGTNGVYKYAGGFPKSPFNNSNYWVDVLFTQTIAQSSTSVQLTNITDANGCSNAGNLSTATLTVNPLPIGTLSASQAVCDGQQINLNFNATSGTGPYSILVNAVNHANVISNQPFSTTINAAPPSTTKLSIWSSDPPIGLEPVVTDNSAVELGVKFKSSITGSITGIRFYKRVQNTGVHTGSLWTSTGTLLASATFTNETASGWQEVSFPYPIAITANQVFVASYYAPVGQYAYTQNYFNGYSASNPPLIAPQTNATDGPNGVHIYGGGFPTSAFNNNNYWVDVLFTASQGNNLINLTQITDANGCSTIASPIQTVDIPTAQCVPLPVTLVDFHLNVSQKKVLLQWTTASENNNSGFEVQRSNNNNSWTTLGFVKGAGTSALGNHYSFTDPDLPNGKYYYRLKQVDYDNKFKLTNILTAEIKGGLEFYLGQNYPNPTAGNTIINYSVQETTPVNISLYDLYGRMIKILVNDNKTAGQYTVTADLHSLTPGTYYYRMNAGNFTETKKIVVANR